MDLYTSQQNLPRYNAPDAACLTIVTSSLGLTTEHRKMVEEVAMSTTRQFASAGELFDQAGIRDLTTSVLSLLRTATSEVERDREAAKTCIARASSLLQIEADRQHLPNREVISGGLAPWQIQRVKTFVEQRLPETIRAGDLSAVARLCVTHFSRAFRRSFGEAPHAYVIRRRLDRARHLMLTSDMALSELALACGFSDQAHLCKLFRCSTGTTPAAWRRERREATSAGAAAEALLQIVTASRSVRQIEVRPVQ